MRVLWKDAVPAVKLDRKDERILAAVAGDARVPVARIAKTVGLSPQSVQYRIDRLRARHVLVGARVALSYRAFGFQAYHLFLSVPHLQPETIAAIANHPNVSTIVQYLGRWDLEIIAFVRDAKELQRVRDELAAIHGHPQDEQALLRFETLRASALPGTASRSTAAPTGPPPDDEDRRLLRALLERADAPVAQLAATSGLTRDQVAYRLRRLMASGTIRGFPNAVNFSALGYDVHVVLLRLRSAPSPAVLQGLFQDRAVLWAARCIGPWDIVCYALTRNPSELAAFLDACRTHLEIARLEVLIAHLEHKYLYAPGILA